MDYRSLIAAVADGRPRAVEKMVREALDGGAEASEVLERGLLEAMRQAVGAFSEEDADIARTLASARAVKHGMQILAPELKKQGMSHMGKVLIGTADGDLHDVGKNLVSLCFQGAGFEVIDLGVDVQAERFVEALKADPAINVVCISAMLASAVPGMRHILQKINELKNRSSIFVMLGGGAVTCEMAEAMGADCYTQDAFEAVERAKRAI